VVADTFRLLRYFGRILDKIRLHSPDQAEEAVELQAIKVLPAE
jgi:hypothetical protein